MSPAAADPDGDGQPNSPEIASGGDPSGGTDNAKVFSLTGNNRSGSAAELLMSIVVRAGAPAPAGYEYRTLPLEGSDGLPGRELPARVDRPLPSFR